MPNTKPDSPQLLIPSAVFLMLEWVARFLFDQPAIKELGLHVHVANFNEQMVRSGAILPALYLFPVERDQSQRVEGVVFPCRAWLLVREATVDLASPTLWTFAELIGYELEALARAPHRGGPVRLPPAEEGAVGQPIDWLKLQKNGLITERFRPLSPRTMDGFAIAHGQWSFRMVCSAPYTWSDFGGGLLPDVDGP